MARIVRTQIVATGKPAGQFQFELQKIVVGISGREVACFDSYYYSMESAEKAQKKLDKKIGKK